VKTGSVQLLLHAFNIFFLEGDKTCQEMSEQFVPCQAAVFVWRDGDSGAATGC